MLHRCDSDATSSRRQRAPTDRAAGLGRAWQLWRGIARRGATQCVPWGEGHTPLALCGRRQGSIGARDWRGVWGLKSALPVCKHYGHAQAAALCRGHAQRLPVGWPLWLGDAGSVWHCCGMIAACAGAVPPYLASKGHLQWPTRQARSCACDHATLHMCRA
jgi:hypothetical protein